MGRYVIQVNARLKGSGGEDEYVSVNVSQELSLTGDKTFSLDMLWLSVERKLRQDYGEKFDRIVNFRIMKEQDVDISASSGSDLRPAVKTDPSRREGKF
ncbi:MAG: hypothetical protein PHC97_01115 [Patescibacteria group bacterium]|nr:hypothetical protein [Patescibacteria group bacterium]